MFLPPDERIHIGVVRLGLAIPGARSKKDRRQAVRSVADRMRHRFDVTVNEIDLAERPTEAVLVVTTAGNDARAIRRLIDHIEDFVASSGMVVLTRIDGDVLRWSPDDLLSRQ